jgi:hypothetical protein
MTDILGAGAYDSTAVMFDCSNSPAIKEYWDQKYGTCLSNADFSEIILNLKSFAWFLRDIS